MVLKDKGIIISGASEGIGRAIALRLAEEGANLALVARSAENLQRVTSEIKAAGGHAKSFICDIRNTEQIKISIESIVHELGAVHILVNNAGIWQKLNQLDEIDDSIINEVLTTNLRGTVYMTKYALPYLRSQPGEAAIINIISKSGIVTQEGQSIYTASKYGVKGFTDVLRADLKDAQIRVGGVYQSGTNTEMFRKSGEGFSQEKFTEPQDLASVIAYILTCPAKLWIPEIHVTY